MSGFNIASNNNIAVLERPRVQEKRVEKDAPAHKHHKGCNHSAPLDIETELKDDLKPALNKEEKGFFQELHDFATKHLANPWINKILIAGDLFSAGSDFVKYFLKDKAKGTLFENLLPGSFLKDFVDEWSVRLTKAAIMIRYINAGLGAFLNKRIVEAFGRVAGILPLPFVKLEDLTLATGLSTFFSQTDLGLEQKIGASKKSSYESMIENAKEWFGNWLEMSADIIKNGFSMNSARLLFPDFKLEQITDIPRRFYEDFMTPKHTIGKPGEKEKGHTAVFGAYMIGGGALIGVLFGRKARNIWNKLGGLIRNIGGILGDYTLVTHPDPNVRKGGYFFGMATIIDVVQRFMPDWVINTINHVNCINNIIASDYYALRTQKRTEGDIAQYGDEVSQAA